jgi:cytidylate kinase
MYRAVTWAALQRGLDIADQERITRLASEVQIDIAQPSVDDGRQYTVYVNGEDVTWDLRRPQVEIYVSPVSAYAGVRQALTLQQRRVGQQGKMVMVGRDIGTVVLPNAELKIYLEASAEARARRRYLERLQRQQECDYDDILHDMCRRDKIDSERDAAPLRPADDAVIIDTTDMDIAQVMAWVWQLVEERDP